MNVELQELRIFGIPKMLSRYKLKTLLQRYIGVGAESWHLQYLIPLEEQSMAEVICCSQEVCQRFLALNAEQLPSLPSYSHLTVQRIPADLSCVPSAQLQAELSPAFSLLHLNNDCLRLIIEQCTLKAQVALAKVCQHLYKLVQVVWRQRYSTLLFSLHHFKVVDALSDEELWDFCLAVGGHARRLVFNSVLFLSVMESLIRNRDGNMMQNAKRAMNVLLCRHLVHFDRLECFEVQGKFLADYTVRELARYCPHLRQFQLTDAGTSWLVGKHLHLLRQLQVLNVQDCECLRRRCMRRACRALQLRALNVLECKQLLMAPYMTQLCGSLTHVQSLRLTAIADGRMLTAILRLPLLRELRFYWYNDFVEFEQMLFAQLQQQRRETLQALSCSNEPIFVENLSQRVWRAGEYAAMRELVTINGRPWQWRERFEELLAVFEQFSGLTAITCEYCRPFTTENLLALAERCKQLRYIKLVGCREECDGRLLELWRRKLMGKCELTIEGVTTWQAVQHCRERVLPYRKEHHKQPILRSIECTFGCPTEDCYMCISI